MGPFPSFLIICSKLKFQKAQRVPLFLFLALWDCFKILIFRFFRNSFQKKIPNIFNVFFNFFDILQQTGFSKSRKGPPFYKRFFEP